MKRKTSFLEFYKTVLDRVKFDEELFWKEYWKAVKNLNTSEVDHLNSWIANEITA